jgi:REP element-mobilizing transposase RayT
MPRPPRIQAPGGIYHVISKAVHEGLLFRDDSDRRRWLRLMGFVAERYRWDCFIYCLLGNHYHLVLRIRDATLAAGMQYLNSRHAEGYNHRYGRQGCTVGARYFSELLKSPSHALEVSRYIPLNPVRAGLSRTPEEWLWSSYGATIGIRRGPRWLKPDWVLGLFSPDPEKARELYRRFVEDKLAATLDLPQRGLTPAARWEARSR